MKEKARKIFTRKRKKEDTKKPKKKRRIEDDRSRVPYVTTPLEPLVSSPPDFVPAVRSLRQIAVAARQLFKDLGNNNLI